MKKLGTTSLICVGFIAGIAFVYSCGGGGSSSGAAATIGELEARVVALEAKLANVVINNNPLVGLSGPHFIFSGVNVHVRNGAAQSNTTNGVGNLVIGYNESSFADSSKRTGSHNLVIGQEHEFSRYNGLVAGFNNRLEGVHSTVSGGSNNVAGGLDSSVSGGYGNSAGGNYASISGGATNSADGNYASVSGGRINSAGGGYASVSGGNDNSAAATYQSDETPDYDSGWQSININNYIDFTHNLGGDVNDYTVVLEQKDTTGNWGINNKWLGTDVYYVSGSRNDVGSFWVNLGTASVRVWRNPQDISSDQVRIKIWLHKS